MWLIGALLCWALGAQAQSDGDWSGSLQFLEDSVRVGDPTPVAVVLRYPAHWQVLMPDSTANFAPFEYDHRWYATTRTDSGISVDSAVYYLATFEIEERQGLGMAFRVVSERDTAVYRLAPDSITFWDVIPVMPDSLIYETQAVLEPLPHEFNSPYWTVGGVLALIVVIVVSLFMARPLGRWWKRRRLARTHERWLQRAEQLTEALATADGVVGELPEQWMNHWKAYLEGLENRPYTKLTTRELAQYQELAGLQDSLKQFDRAIYGKKSEGGLSAQALKLKDYAQNRYKARLEALNG